MEKFTTFTGTACPIDQSNLNTDQILPARYLKWTRAMGFGKVLFHDLRFDAEGREKSDFPLNKPVWRKSTTLVSARNFGCGSSREAAVYALYDFGVRCVIAPSFGDIFAGNAVQNGLLTAIVTEGEAAEIMGSLAQMPELPVTVDLEQQSISASGEVFHFSVDALQREGLLEGLDEIGLTLKGTDEIAAWQSTDRAQRPWVWQTEKVEV